MIEQPVMPGPVAEVSSVAGLLAAARERRRVADAAEADLLVLACEWAEVHPPESIAHAAGFHVPGGTEEEEPIAGVGCPLVAEFCIAEFGAVLGMSTASTKHLIGQALELKYRLPRRVAEATIHADPR